MSTADEAIRGEIAQNGTISFARFMELALYHPEDGYYERESGVTGKQGDYYTSVSVGPVFGELLGFQFARWLERLGDGRLHLVEAGAHDGALAADVLASLREFFPALFSRIEYWLIEPSTRRQHWQAERLARFGSVVHWAARFDGLPAHGLRGVVFCNELLDAMPVSRFRWDAAARVWREWGVAVAGDAYIWRCREQNGTAGGRSAAVAAVGPRACPSWMTGLPDPLREALPDGYTVDVSPAAGAWWETAAKAMRQGWLMAIDYGFGAEGRLVPERVNGTLRAYHGHRCSDQLLDRPGRQDLTAHVDFATLQSVGEQAGLTTTRFGSQGRFLAQIAADAQALPDRFPAWTAERRRQLVTLTHPAHLGRAFQVLIQTRA